MLTRATATIVWFFAATGCQRLPSEEPMVVGTWQITTMCTVVYMIVEPNHTLAGVSDDSGDLKLFATGSWRLDRDDMVFEFVELQGDDKSSQPKQSTHRMKIAEFIKTRTRHAPVKYRVP